MGAREDHTGGRGRLDDGRLKGGHMSRLQDVEVFGSRTG